MMMLLYKAWVETRVRFFVGLCAAALVCTFYLQQHAWLVQMWTGELRNPHGFHAPWMYTAIHEYGWYLWHFLYENYLQQVWSLFAVMFAFGGLIREKTIGSAHFSLGLPVSRRRWLVSRLSVAVLESVALSLFAVAYVAVGSRVIHQPFPTGEMIMHSLLMVAAGIVLVAFGNFCYNLFPGSYLSLLITLVLLGVPYLLLQLYMQNMSDAGRSTWLGAFDIAHAMAGPWQLTWATTPWLALCGAWGLAILFFAASAVHGDRLDY